MTTLLLLILIIYFILKCIAIKQRINKGNEMLDKFESLHLDFITKRGNKFKMDKTSDDVTLEFTTKDGQTFKLPN